MKIFLIICAIFIITGLLAAHLLFAEYLMFAYCIAGALIGLIGFGIGIYNWKKYG